MGNALRAQVLDDFSATETHLLHDFVMARIAPAGGATRSDIVRDLTPFLSHRLSPSQIREEIELALVAGEQDGLFAASRGRYRLTEAGSATALVLLGGRSLPRDWPEARDVRLPARALGLEKDSAQRIKSLARPDGLRAAILQQFHGLKGKRTPTAARLRASLAGIALGKAFGEQIKGDVAAGEGLSANAGRQLAGQLARRPRDFGTDSRLIAALAAEAVGAIQSDLASLRMAVLRNAITRRMPAQALTQDNLGRAREPTAQPGALNGNHPKSQRLSSPPSIAQGRDSRPAAATRPDLSGFAKAVLAAAEPRSEGWPGNRKTLIVHAWEDIQARYPEWGLTEIEFKAMLTEAHRTGHLILANADLKAKNNARDIQDSAISFKNTVWHFIRVED